MKAHKASIRYAKSLLNLAVMQNELDIVYSDVKLIEATLKQNRELRLVLNNPVVKQDKKSTIISKIFGDKIGPLSASFLEILVLKKRESIISDICHDFQKLYRKHLNIVNVSIQSATEINSEAKVKIKALIQELANGKIELEEVVNPQLIGGFSIKIGDMLIDETIASKLHQLKKEFSQNPYITKL